MHMQHGVIVNIKCAGYRSLIFLLWEWTHTFQ